MKNGRCLFNFGKCKCLHTGHGNLDINYNMGGIVLGTTVKEKNLGDYFTFGSNWEKRLNMHSLAHDLNTMLR